MDVIQIINLMIFHLLILCGGDKGGTGKTVTAKVFSEYFLTHYPEILALVECDRSNPDVGRVFKDKVLNFILAFFSDDPAKLTKADALFNAAVNNLITVCNLPAQVNQTIKTWLIEDNLYELAEELKVKITYLFVSDGGYDSIKLFLQTIEDFGPYMRIVFVRNWGLCDNWTHVDADQDVQAAITTHNVPIIDLPKLPHAERNFLEINQITFTEALEHPNLSVVSKQRIKVFLRKCFAQIEDIEFISYGEEE